MKLIYYIFLICNLLNFLNVFAEKLEKDSIEFKSVKWEKVNENESSSLKKIFWRSDNEDENYFRKDPQEDQEKGDPKEDLLSEKNKKFFDKNKLFEFGGLTVENSILPKGRESYINIDYDSSGNLFSSYSYSLSKKFQLSLINIGSFKLKNNAIRRNSQLTNTYLGRNNLNYRVGGKVKFFSSEKSDLIWLTSRVSYGRDLDSAQDYIYSDLTSTIKINNWMIFNISPKYIFSGVGNLGAVGLSSNMNLSNKFQFIAETNLGITQNSIDNSTFSLRYAYSPLNSIDVFVTNAIGFQDISTMLGLNNYKFGIRMNYFF